LLSDSVCLRSSFDFHDVSLKIGLRWAKTLGAASWSPATCRELKQHGFCLWHRFLVSLGASEAAAARALLAHPRLLAERLPQRAVELRVAAAAADVAPETVDLAVARRPQLLLGDVRALDAVMQYLRSQDIAVRGTVLRSR
jgi:hypothetical protein